MISGLCSKQVAIGCSLVTLVPWGIATLEESPTVRVLYHLLPFPTIPSGSTCGMPNTVDAFLFSLVICAVKLPLFYLKIAKVLDE